VSNVVRELCIGKVFVFEDLGGRILKGFSEPVQLHEVRWSDAPPSSRRALGAL
jgi:class 3 adenylate cyclase